MFECGNCGCRFTEPDRLDTTYERYYGVGSLFPNHHSLTIEVCPRCGSDDFSEINLCETCRWKNVDPDSVNYCDNNESHDCDDYEEE